MKTKILNSTILAAGLSLGVSSAQADDGAPFSTVRELLDGYEKALDAFAGAEVPNEPSVWIDIVECVSTLSAVSRVLIWNCDSFERGNNPEISAGSPPSTEAAVQSFVNWARANPASWDQPPVDGAIVATVTSFPCIKAPE